MAKFTAGADLNIRLPGGFEISGASGATHRIPDSLVEEFTRDLVPAIPGFAWVTQDETSAIPSLPLAQSDVTDLTADLATKYDKAGGTISGAVTVSTSLVAQSIGGVIYADRYSSLAAAITAIPAGGAEVSIPAGTYALSAALSIPSNTRLRGAGVATVITQSANTPIIQVAASASAVLIEGMRIIGSATSASTSAFGVHVQAGCQDIHIRDVSVETCCRSIEVVQASSVTVERVNVTGDVSDLGAIDCNQATSVSVRDCIIESPRTHGVDFRETSIECQATGCRVTSPGSTGYVISTNCRGCSIIGNVSSGGQHGAVVEIGSEHSIVAENYVVDATTNGVLVSAGGSTHPASTIIRGNAIKSAGSRGVWNSGGDHTVIAGNSILGYLTDGIRTNGSNNFASIVGNAISGGTSSSGSGINVDTSADDCVVSGNVVQNVAGKGIYINAARAIVIGNNVTDADNGGVLTIGGIQLSGSAHRTVVSGNTSRRSAGTMQDYGVVVQSGCTNAVVIGNTLFENTTGGLSDSGTGTTSASNVTT